MPWRALWAGAEGVVAVSVGLTFAHVSGAIQIDPMVRVGQVAGMAQLQLRFAVAAIALVAAVLTAHRLLPPRYRPVATRLACAAAAGLSTGLVAGGVDVALRGTPYGLWAGKGDYGWMLTWIDLQNGGLDVPDYYPPANLWLIRISAYLTGEPYVYAIKGVQVIGTALFGPAAYLAWRLVLTPLWALGIGVIAMLPLIEPVKPYPQLTLVVLIPVAIRFLGTVRSARRLSTQRAVALGTAFGIGLGLLFLLYSGWFVWCSLGFVAAFALLVPKREAWPQVIALTLTTAAAFAAVSWKHLTGVLTETGGAGDNYFYFDTDTEPAYFAIWLNDRPGDVGVWPPLGELGHVSLFPALLVLGVGAALWLGWRRTAVVVLGLIALGAWLIRMWLAGRSYETMIVALYPRTSALLLYSTLVLTGLAIRYGVSQGARLMRERPATPPAGLALVPLLFLLALSGSATIDHYLPGARGSAGEFALLAHITPLQVGGCPPFGAGRGCGTGPAASPLPPVVPAPTPASTR